MVNPRFFRPLDVENLHGNPEKALKLLGWSTKITFEEMIKEMVEEDIRCLN
jgi:GDPmannose 4,6-dehydratase